MLKGKGKCGSPTNVLSLSHINVTNATIILSVRKLRTAEFVFVKFDFTI